MAFKQVMCFQHFVYVPVHVCVFLYCHIETQRNVQHCQFMEENLLNIDYPYHTRILKPFKN